jgi:hypothetical protein
MSTRFSFNDYETKQLLNLIDDFQNTSMTNKTDELVDDNLKEEEDLFQSYMKQKKEEYERSKYLTNLDLSSINQLNKSSSGKGTLSSSSSVNSLNNEEDFVHNRCNQYQNKHVTFGSDQKPAMRSRPRSTSRTRTEKTLLQTVNNELKSVHSNVESVSSEEQKRIAYLLKSVYNEDLKDAETILRESLVKVKNRSNLTNELYLNAFNANNICEGEDKHLRPKFVF